MPRAYLLVMVNQVVLVAASVFFWFRVSGSPVFIAYKESPPVEWMILAFALPTEKRGWSLTLFEPKACVPVYLLCMFFLVRDTFFLLCFRLRGKPKVDKTNYESSKS